MRPPRAPRPGAMSGGLVGGLIGLLGSLLIPGVGPIVVGGVLASTLTGAGIGAATGGIIGALMGLGVPEADAPALRHRAPSGRTLVTVGAGARTDEALAILERHGMDFGPSGRVRATHSGIDAAGEPAVERPGRVIRGRGAPCARGTSDLRRPGAAPGGRLDRRPGEQRGGGGRMALSPVVLPDYRVPRKEHP